VLIHNDSDSEATVNIRVNTPTNWSEVNGGGSYLVPAHQSVELYVKAKTSAAAGNEPQKLAINAEAPGAKLEPIDIFVHADRAALPQ
jgi:hypothetical protein